MVGIPSRKPAVEGGGISDFDIIVGSDFHRGFSRFFLLREMVHCAELGKPASLLSGGSVVMRSNAMWVGDSSESKDPCVIDGRGSCDLHRKVVDLSMGDLYHIFLETLIKGI
ncbi:unnamed protein product [Calypogeia fissa]